jgi:hypothetical protein
VLCKKIRSKFAILRKLATRTPVSTNRSFSFIPKKGTLESPKKYFLPDSFSRGLTGYNTGKLLKNSRKKIPCYLLGYSDIIIYDSKNLLMILKLCFNPAWVIC